MTQLPSIDFLYQLFKQHPQVQTDTRKLQAGDLYFALKGPNFNGNLFAEKALAAGASFAIIDEPIEIDKKWDAQIFIVADCLTCLQALAKHHRTQFNIPFIGITGSNGKTTTKELVTAVLSSYFITYTTQGNLNNHIGVPLTLLSIQADAQMAVIEMGANHLKEIESYCEYAMPNFGLITNCGKAHLEGFGSEAGVKKAKGELYDYLRTHNGAAFVMGDYDYLVQMSAGIQHVITYGTQTGTVQGIAKSNKGMLAVEMTSGFPAMTIQTQLVGDYNLPNVLAAVTIGVYFNIPADKIKRALENYAPSNSRSQLIRWNENDIILDAYNANPSSMKLAVENFANLAAPHKILFLGGMKELGTSSVQEHQQLIDFIDQHKWEQVVLVGGDFNACTHSYLYFEDAQAAKKWLLQQTFKGYSFLIKGSRGIQMEQLIS